MALVASLSAVPAWGQQTVPTRLSLPDAIELARGNNPGLQSARRQIDAADWGVRSAWGQLLPSLTVGTGLSWQGAGEQVFGSLTAEQLGFADQPSFYFSSYSVNLGYQLSGSRVLAPGQTGAQRDASAARVRTTEADLEFAVTQQYLALMRAREELRLAQQELERAQFNVRLARGQLEVGTATQLDVTQAEVAVGRSEVAVLRARTSVHNSELALAQWLGLPTTGGLELTSTFELQAPDWTEDDLFSQALEGNPLLASLTADERASEYGVRVARSAYYPTLSVSGGISGFTRQASSVDGQVASARAQAQAQISQCQALNELFRRLADPLPAVDCANEFAFDPEIESFIRERNDVFPFDFTRQPTSFQLSVSVPVFQGLTRQRALEQAQVDRDALRYQIRSRELELRTLIAVGVALVETAYEEARIEERNQRLASEQLRLAQEQYRVGTASFLDLVEAETVRAQADRAVVDAIFNFHENVASLESLVGSRLRAN